MDHHPHEDDHDDHGGLAIDASRFLDRRNALRLIAGFGVIGLAACTKKADDTAGTTTSPASTTGASPPGGGTAENCATIPEETGGPFPADGSQGANAPNVLTESGVVRKDITKSFGASSGVADGVPLTINLKVVNVADDCNAYEGAAVYLWHCDREGNYSLYSPDAVNENYLRGVQVADADGNVTFESIFPAAYQGRWPHMHFEVYPTLDDASKASGKLSTSQLALPKDICDEAYAEEGYEQSVQNLAQTSLESDMVFADGYSAQLAKMSGTVSNGLTATLTVAV